MVEKVAKAMLKDAKNQNVDFRYVCYTSLARAAIKALREPTEEMMNVDAPDMPAGGDIKEIWQAMIDAALKDA
jgi:hypothetical protein